MCAPKLVMEYRVRERGAGVCARARARPDRMPRATPHLAAWATESAGAATPGRQHHAEGWEPSAFFSPRSDDVLGLASKLAGAGAEEDLDDDAVEDAA